MRLSINIRPTKGNLYGDFFSHKAMLITVWKLVFGISLRIPMRWFWVSWDNNSIFMLRVDQYAVQVGLPLIQLGVCWNPKFHSINQP